VAEQIRSGFNLLDWLYQDDACAALLDFDATFFGLGGGRARSR